MLSLNRKYLYVVKKYLEQKLKIFAQGYGDKYAGQPGLAGRHCESCPTEFCNNKGSCSVDTAGARVCECEGNFYGDQCQIDGEVLAVAIGASVAAVIIIVLTLVCLCMWR